MEKMQLKDKKFTLSISAEEIQLAVKEIANKINHDFKNKSAPVFVSILNGSFMFTADLLKRIEAQCEITFLKLASYEGTGSSGNVKRLIGLNESLQGRNVIVLEDIVDTGITLEQIIKEIDKFKPESLKVATLLFKPEAYQKNIGLDYIGMEIPNRFIVGYGLDYDGLGRNLPDIYALAGE